MVLSWLPNGAFQTLLILLAPFLYTRGRQTLYAFRQWKNAPRRKGRRRAAWELALLIFALSAFALLGLLTWPLNVFTALGLPLNVAPQLLRAAYVQRFGALNELTHRLLAKLGTLDGRLAYIRLGELPLLSCTFCGKYTDYALYVLPPRIGIYVACSTVVGVIADLRWRPSLSYILGTAFVVESIVLLLPDLTNTTKEASLASILHASRYSLFLMVTLAAYLLPERRNALSELVPALRETVAAHERAALRQRMTTLQKNALLLDKEGREKTIETWSGHAEIAAVARGDPHMQDVLERLDLKPEGVKLKELESFVDAALTLPVPRGRRANDAIS